MEDIIELTEEELKEIENIDVDAGKEDGEVITQKFKVINK